MSVILGIDPGSRITGYGVIDTQSSNKSAIKPRYIASGCIRLSEESIPNRLLTIHECLNDLIREYQPSHVSIEKVFVGKSADSALKLGQARGVAILSAAQANLPVFEYAARTIKQAVSGMGAATKVQVQEMVVQALSLNATPAADAADALAIALCHFYSMPLQQRIKASKSKVICLDQ